MSYLVIEENRNKLLALLKSNPVIDYKDVLDIADAFQIASGQSFAIGRTKALLEFLAQGNTLAIVYDSTKSEMIKKSAELALFLKKIDASIDLMGDDVFKEYF